METLTIKLSDAHREFVEAQTATRGFKSVSAYIDALLREERRRQAEEKLLQLVKEAEESGPATPMTREDWDELKSRVWKREGQSKGTRRGRNTQNKRRPARSG